MNNDKEFHFQTYLISHAEELKQFSKDVNILSSSALTQLQRLPISLRRRAASHKTRRLPFRFRKLAKAVPAKKIQRKCRYYIRRRLNLKSVYLKRQLKIKWLYTHIWHAKRFKTVNKWGWRVPYEPAQKTFRPCTKAMTNGCCVADISYFCTLELLGKVNKVINKLLTITGQECQSLKIQIKSGKQVSFVMYRPNKWPYNAIGPCRIIRISKEQEIGSSFLLSFHASCRDEVIQAVSEIFTLQHIGWNIWTSGTDSRKIIIRDRSAEFSRFRLIGSRSQHVIHGLLDDSSPFRAAVGRPISEIPAGYAFEVEIEDLKSKRPPLKQTDIIGFSSYDTEYSVAVIPVRQLDESSRFRTYSDIAAAIKENNKSNMEQLVKFDLDPIIDGEKCPVLMSRIHYQDGKAAGGWEIIVPAKWSMKMWMALVMKGCRPIGYRYWARYCALEANSLQAKYDCFPIFGWPDTSSGALESDSSRDKQALLWKRRPSSKRVNFTRCVTESPFSCPWQRLLSNSVDQPFYVIRDINMLFRVVQQILDGTVKPTVDELNQFSPDARWALVSVNLESCSTVPSSNAIVMAANLDDDKQVAIEADKSLIRPVIGYLELADQSLTVGQGRGFGFVSLYQAVCLCQSHRPLSQLVWFKNPNTKRFVAGKLSLSI